MFKSNLNIATYDFKNNFINIITAKSIENATEFVTHLCEEFKLIKNVTATIFDAEGIIQEKRKNLQTDYYNYISNMQTDLNKGKHNICIIIGIDKFLLNVEKEFNSDLKKADEAENYSFLIVDSVFKLKNHEFDDWYKNYVSKDRGIWVGNGISDQYLIRLNSSNRNIINNCGDSFGYIINQEEATMVKLLGIKELGEENG